MSCEKVTIREQFAKICPNSYRINFSGRLFVKFDSVLQCTIKRKNLVMKAKYFNKSDEREKLFFRSLKDRVNEQLQYKNVSSGNFSFWAKGLFWASVSYSCYLVLFSDGMGKLGFWLFYLFFQLSGLLIGFSLGHDASHNTAFKN